MGSRWRERWVLVLLLASVLSGLAAIQAMFLREHQETLERLRLQRSQQLDHARRVLALVLSDELAQRRDRFEAAVRDPLVAGQDLFLQRGGEVLLPRRWSESAEDGRALAWQAVVLGRSSAPTELEGPVAERLDLARAAFGAFRAGDRGSIEAAVRAFLAHRARFLIPAEIDVPVTLALLSALEEESTPDPSLMSSLLRDGLALGPQLVQEGLMRQFLRRRDRFGERDLAELADQLRELAQRHGISTSDFEARLAERSTSGPEFDASIESPAVASSFDWYFEPGTDEVRGFRFDAASILAKVKAELVLRSFVPSSEQLLPPEPSALSPPESVPVLELPLRLSATSLDEQSAAAQRRLLTKTTLTVSTAGLSVLLFVLVLAGQRRERALVELKADFVSTVSHELRTPLASVRLLAETLERRLDGDERAKDYPARIVREIDGASFLVENILSFQRIDKGRWALYPEPVEVLELFRSATSELSRQLGKAVSIRTGGGPALLRLDPELTRLMCANLVKNAILYNEKDGATIAIEIERRAGQVVISIQDDGVGIPEAEQASIFAAFQRGSGWGRTRRPGSGLGLALVRRIMQLHGGEVRLVRSDASGSRFELHFPAGLVEAI